MGLVKAIGHAETVAAVDFARAKGRNITCLKIMSEIAAANMPSF